MTGSVLCKPPNTALPSIHGRSGSTAAHLAPLTVHLPTGLHVVCQGKAPHLKEVVAQLKATHDITYVYCWHALAAYWAGISPRAPAMAAYEPVLHWPVPPTGILEVDPSLAWSSKVLGGVALARDVQALHRDMHSYLQGE